MPTLNDLYYTFIGNKYLNPEYTTQYNLGVTYAKNFDGVLRRIDFQADAYYNEVDDKIVAMPTSNQFQWTMINLGRVEIRGIETTVQTNWLFGPVTFNARLNYTYQKAQDVTDRTSEWYGGQIPLYPVAQRFRRTESRLPGMGSELQLPLHRRTLRIRREHPRKLRAAVVYARHGALEIHPVQKNGAAHHRRSEQHLQPAIRSRTMLPDAGHEF